MSNATCRRARARWRLRSRWVARELGRSDHCRDHHAGGRLHSDRNSGRLDRGALPRVRLHPAGRRHRFRCGRADPAPMMSSKLLREGDAERALPAWINRQFDRLRTSTCGVLGVTVGHRWAVIAFCAVIGLFGRLPHVFRRANWRRMKIRVYLRNRQGACERHS